MAKNSNPSKSPKKTGGSKKTSMSAKSSAASKSKKSGTSKSGGSPYKRPSSPRRPKKSKKLLFAFFILLVVVIVLLGLTYWYYSNHPEMFEGSSENPSSEETSLNSSEILSSSSDSSESSVSSVSTSEAEEDHAASKDWVHGKKHAESLGWSETKGSADLTIVFPELGNANAGDSVFIKAGDTDILIDAGSRLGSYERIEKTIDKYCTDKALEYVVATHAHQDHIAAFYSTGTKKYGIFADYTVRTIIDFGKQTKYEDSSKSVKKTDVYKAYVAGRQHQIDLGAKYYTAAECYNETDGAQRVYQIADGIEMEILGQKYYSEYYSGDNENLYSVSLMINQGENRFLFTGDLEDDGQESLVETYPEKHGGQAMPHCILFKAGHHGSVNACNEKLLAQITPAVVPVMCCAGSSEYTSDIDNQFPTQTFVDRMAKYTSNIFVPTMDTDISNKSTFVSMNGDITVTSTADSFDIRFSASAKKLKNSDWFNSTTYRDAAGKYDSTQASPSPMRVWPDVASLYN